MRKYIARITGPGSTSAITVLPMASGYSGLGDFSSFDRSNLKPLGVHFTR